MIGWVNVNDLHVIFLPSLTVIYSYVGEVAYNQVCVLFIQIKSQNLISTRINYVYLLNAMRMLTIINRVARESRHFNWLLPKHAKLFIFSKSRFIFEVTHSVSF